MRKNERKRKCDERDKLKKKLTEINLMGKNGKESDESWCERMEEKVWLNRWIWEKMKSEIWCEGMEEKRACYERDKWRELI